MAVQSVTQDRLKELLDYSPDTGVFVWKVDRKAVKAGDVAGKRHHSGYWNLFVDGKWLMAHRAAWLYVHGVWPDGDIDHINRIRDDNRLCNLRTANRAENCQNQPTRRNNRSGVTGVLWHKAAKKWVAQISIDRKLRHLGVFDTKELAVEARKAAELAHYPFKVA